LLASSKSRIKRRTTRENLSSKPINLQLFDRWEAHGMMGLYTKKGRGSKPTFTQEQKEKIKEWTKEEPRQLKRIVEKVKEEWGIITSTSTIKRILKTLNMSWHRMRRACPNIDGMGSI